LRRPVALAANEAGVVGGDDGGPGHRLPRGWGARAWGDGHARTAGS